jgi:hypothetical protein
MITSAFIRIGPNSDQVFNVSRINSIFKETVTITEEALKLNIYDGLPIIDNKGYCINIHFSGSGGMQYFYSSEAMRDATFEKIIATLNPLVITKPDLEKAVAPTP